MREQCDFAHRSLNAPERAQRWRFIIHSGVFTPLGTYARFMSGRFDRRQLPVELRRRPRFRSAFTGSHPLNCAPSSLVLGLGTHRCVHVVTPRGGRAGRVRGTEGAQACGRTLAAPPGARAGAATQWGRIELGPDSRQQTYHCPPSTRAGKGETGGSGPAGGLPTGPAGPGPGGA